jgi:hypothetical protein
MIEHILHDIVVAKNNKAYIAALSLALTLPSILSNIEYGRKTSGAEYKEWFDKWVYDKYYKKPLSENEFINKGIEATKFDGFNCYMLRCALLHSGNTNLEDSKGRRKIDCFVLCTSEISSHEGDASVCSVSSTSASNVYVSINVVGLIDAIVAGTIEYMANNQDKVEINVSQTDYRNVFGGIEIDPREE